MHSQRLAQPPPLLETSLSTSLGGAPTSATTRGVVVMAKAMLSFPVGIGSGSPWKVARAWGPEPLLEPCGGGTAELGQQPKKLVGPDEVLLPLPDHGAPVLIQNEPARVFIMSVTPVGGL